MAALAKRLKTAGIPAALVVIDRNLGEHTASVLGELLGVSEQDLVALAVAGVTE